MNLSRKPFPIALITFVLILMSFDIYLKPNGVPSLHSKIEGMLMGSAIGDAAGGPVEFMDPPLRSVWTSGQQIITREGIEALGEFFKLRPYPKDVEPFAHWEPYTE